MRDYGIVAVETGAFARFGELKDKSLVAAYRAINKTAERTRADAAGRMQRQVNFGASYLAPSAGRLRVEKQANKSSLESNILGRDRATSLARFVLNPNARKSDPLRVQVAPGSIRYLRKAFLVKLRSGTSTETQSNLGLAIRLPPGQTPRRVTAGGAKMIAPGLWLLYGPSVGQVFNLVRNDVEPAALDFLEAEYARQLGL